MGLHKLIVVTICLCLVSALLYDDSDVIELTADNYAKEINEGVWFIKYYISGCGGCHMMVDAWKETATALLGKVRVAAIDLKGAGVSVPKLRGFPTIRFMINGAIDD